MAKSITTNKTIDDGFEGLRELLSGNPFYRPQAEHFWDAQKYVIDETKTCAASWLKRRQSAAAQLVDAMKTISKSGPGDPAASMKAMAELQAGAAERLSEDIRDWFELGSRCASYITRAESEAAEEVVETAIKATASKRMMKDDVPV